MTPMLCTAVVLVAFLALLAAPLPGSGRRVTTSIMTVEILNPGECRQQIQGQRLNSCRHYLRDSVRFTPQNEGNGWREEFPRCCEELEQITTPECRCEAINQITQQQRERGQVQGREMREMLRTAQSLPGLCRISPYHCENIEGGMY